MNKQSFIQILLLFSLLTSFLYCQDSDLIPFEENQSLTPLIFNDNIEVARYVAITKEDMIIYPNAFSLRFESGTSLVKDDFIFNIKRVKFAKGSVPPEKLKTELYPHIPTTESEIALTKQSRNEFELKLYYDSQEKLDIESDEFFVIYIKLLKVNTQRETINIYLSTPTEVKIYNISSSHESFTFKSTPYTPQFIKIISSEPIKYTYNLISTTRNYIIHGKEIDYNASFATEGIHYIEPNDPPIEYSIIVEYDTLKNPEKEFNELNIVTVQLQLNEGNFRYESCSNERRNKIQCNIDCNESNYGKDIHYYDLIDETEASKSKSIWTIINKSLGMLQPTLTVNGNDIKTRNRLDGYNSQLFLMKVDCSSYSQIDILFTNEPSETIALNSFGESSYLIKTDKIFTVQLSNELMGSNLLVEISETSNNKVELTIADTLYIISSQSNFRMISLPFNINEFTIKSASDTPIILSLTNNDLFREIPIDSKELIAIPNVYIKFTSLRIKDYKLTFDMKNTADISQVKYKIHRGIAGFITIPFRSLTSTQLNIINPYHPIQSLSENEFFYISITVPNNIQYTIEIVSVELPKHDKLNLYSINQISVEESNSIKSIDYETILQSGHYAQLKFYYVACSHSTATMTYLFNDIVSDVVYISTNNPSFNSNIDQIHPSSPVNYLPYDIKFPNTQLKSYISYGIYDDQSMEDIQTIISRTYQLEYDEDSQILTWKIPEGMTVTRYEVYIYKKSNNENRRLATVCDCLNNNEDLIVIPLDKIVNKLSLSKEYLKENGVYYLNIIAFNEKPMQINYHVIYTQMKIKYTDTTFIQIESDYQILNNINAFYKYPQNKRAKSFNFKVFSSYFKDIDLQYYEGIGKEGEEIKPIDEEFKSFLSNIGVNILNPYAESVLETDQFYYVAIKAPQKFLSYKLIIDTEPNADIEKLNSDDITLISNQQTSFYLGINTDPAFKTQLVFYSNICETVLPTMKLLYNEEVIELKQTEGVMEATINETNKPFVYYLDYKKEGNSKISMLSYSFMSNSRYAEIQNDMKQEYTIKYDDYEDKLIWDLPPTFNKSYSIFITKKGEVKSICDLLELTPVDITRNNEYLLPGDKFQEKQYAVNILSFSHIDLSFPFKYKELIFERKIRYVNAFPNQNGLIVTLANTYYTYTNAKDKMYSFIFEKENDTKVYQLQYAEGIGKIGKVLPITTLIPFNSNEGLSKINPYKTTKNYGLGEDEFYYLAISVPQEFLGYKLIMKITPEERSVEIEKNKLIQMTKEVKSHFINPNIDVSNNYMVIYSLTCDSMTPNIALLYNDIRKELQIDQSKPQALESLQINPIPYYLEYTKNGNDNPNYLSYSTMTFDKYNQLKTTINIKYGIKYDSEKRKVTWNKPSENIIEYDLYIDKKEEDNEVLSACDLFSKKAVKTLEGNEYKMTNKDYNEENYKVNVLGKTKDGLQYYIEYGEIEISFIPEPKEPQSLLWLWISLGIAAFVILVIVCVILMMKKQQNTNISKIDENLLPSTNSESF